MKWLTRLFTRNETKQKVPTKQKDDQSKQRGLDLVNALQTLATKGEFKSVSTKSPEEATSVLFEQALPATPDVSKESVLSGFEGVKRPWASQKLFKGSEEEIKNIILANLKQLRSAPNFREFVVEVRLADFAAQINAITPPYFCAVRVWRSGHTIYVCGNSQFR